MLIRHAFVPYLLIADTEMFDLEYFLDIHKQEWGSLMSFERMLIRTVLEEGESKTGKNDSIDPLLLEAQSTNQHSNAISLGRSLLDKMGRS